MSPTAYPAGFIGALLGLLNAVLILLVSFGVDVTEVQVAATNGVGAALGAVWVTRRVTPVEPEDRGLVSPIDHRWMP